MVALLKPFPHCAFAVLQPADDRFAIDYSLGAVSGHVGLDTLSIGTPPITVMQQAFGLATGSTADFSTTSCDGVFVSHLLPPFPDPCALCMPCNTECKARKGTQGRLFFFTSQHPRIYASMLNMMPLYFTGNGAASAGEAEEWRNAVQGLNLLQDGALCKQHRLAFMNMLHSALHQIVVLMLLHAHMHALVCAHTFPQHRLKQTLWVLQQQLDAPVFTIWVSANDSQPITGELTFGAVKSRYYTGPLVTLPVNSQVGCQKPGASHFLNGDQAGLGRALLSQWC